jgi:hypothetical protein
MAQSASGASLKIELSRFHTGEHRLEGLNLSDRRKCAGHPCLGRLQRSAYHADIATDAVTDARRSNADLAACCGS